MNTSSIRDPRQRLTEASDFLTAFRQIDPQLRGPRVTNLYLSALHLVELAAAYDNPPTQFSIHHDRNVWVQRKRSKLYPHYNAIYNAGSDARYSPSAIGHTVEGIENELYQKHYRSLAGKIFTLINEDLDIPGALGLEFRSPQIRKQKIKA